MFEFKDLWTYTENEKGLRVLMAIISALIIVFIIWLWFKAFIIKPNLKAAETSSQVDGYTPVVNPHQGKNINTGINHGVIGDNAVVNLKPIYIPDNGLIKEIEEAIPDKSRRVFIKAINTESLEFGDKLKTMLHDVGYKDVRTETIIKIPLPPPGVTYTEGGGMQILYINIV